MTDLANEYKRLALQYAKTLDAAVELYEEVEDRLVKQNHRLRKQIDHYKHENQQLRRLLMNYNGSIDIEV